MTTIILIIIGLLLIIFNCLALRKENNTFKNTFKSVDNSISNADMKLMEFRKEFAETVLELQTDMEMIKDTIKDIKENDDNVNNLIKENINEYIINENNEKNSKSFEVIIDDESYNDKYDLDINKDNNSEQKVTSNNNIKINEIKQLLEEGNTDSEIASKLSIGKGEVLLIKELYLK